MTSEELTKPSIELASPHLLGVLSRTSLTGDRQLIHTAFLLAMKNGGPEELDFERPLGASFNPRPGRVGLILIQDAGVTDSEILAAGILGTSRDLDAAKQNANDKDGVLPWELAELGKGGTLRDFQDHPRGPDLAAIYSAHALDRARHAHLAPVERWEEIWHKLQPAFPIAEQFTPRVHELLVTWTRRFQKKLTSAK